MRSGFSRIFFFFLIRVSRESTIDRRSIIVIEVEANQGLRVNPRRTHRLPPQLDGLQRDLHTALVHLAYRLEAHQPEEADPRLPRASASLRKPGTRSWSAAAGLLRPPAASSAASWRPRLRGTQGHGERHGRISGLMRHSRERLRPPRVVGEPLRCSSTRPSNSTRAIRRLGGHDTARGQRVDEI